MHPLRVSSKKRERIFALHACITTTKFVRSTSCAFKNSTFQKDTIKKTIGENEFEAVHPLDPSKLWKLSLYDPLQQLAWKFSRAYIYFVPLKRTRVERDIYELVQGLL